jgi:hypothetical protein
VTVYAEPTSAVTVTISSFALSFSRINVNGYDDGKPLDDATCNEVSDAPIDDANVVVTAVEE